ncbi:hypothetical protein [Brevibacterium otitidis]|uniref:Prepilin type IV endopeptidase peptidase domain-containing protein n=1 Tax=Brevibacterium otitidis TaxID=53364 RepID=A0ABV5X2W5_9MICO|nr:hypothetical protein GCM10023233_11370 [Brevibacterium otitidis]
MIEQLSLVASLTLTVGVALLTSLIIWLRFPWIIDDEAGIRLLRGVNSINRPGGLVTFVLTSVGLVLSWLAAFIVPGALSRTAADIPIMIAVAMLAGATGWLYWVDISIHRLPNRIVMPITGLSLLLFLISLVMGVGQPDHSDEHLWAGAGTGALNGLLGALGMLLLFVILNVAGTLMRRSTMGLGDVKLSISVGLLTAAVSPYGPLLAIVLINGIAVVHVLLLLAARRRQWTSKIAFGPYMLIGTWTTVLVGTAFL